ncbi:ABC transporter permease [Chitinophaga vietnamensis]|uniref:ABC transporter permease n=1 Tax=Chitinophaga vietnamensis TaxID=2593957 RepID=UPI0011780BD7|nr:ABC transporter permease [Chitinophaga vietnamensis]
MIRSIWHIFLREWKRILTLPVHYLVLLVMPPLVCFLYAYIYNEKFAKELPVAIWDEAHSPLSRQFAFMLEQTESIHITQTVNSQAELEEMMKRNIINAAVHFPRNMDNDIKSRHPVYITLYTNTAYVVPGKLIYKDAAQVIMTAGAGVMLQKFVKTGMPAGKAMAMVQPVNLHTYFLYNPQYDYQRYLVPGLVAVALQMMVIMVTVLALNYETHTNTLTDLYTRCGGSASNAIIGKGLAHLTVGWINYLLVTFIMFPLFTGGQVVASAGLFVLYTLLILACISIGMMASAILSDVMVACDAGLFYTSPAFVFSGFTFPRWGMPWYDQYYAAILPFTPFMDAFFKVYFMQLPLFYAYKEIGHLVLFILITLPLAIFFFQRRLNKLSLQHA